MDGFNAFWANYPRKEDKKYTRKQFAKLDSTQQQKATDDCLTRYLGVERCFIPLPSTYINKERFEDDPIPKRETEKDWESFARQYARPGESLEQFKQRYNPED